MSTGKGMSNDSITDSRAVRAGAVVAVSTLVLTACFVGLLSITTGGVPGIGDRLPGYVLVMAIAFAATVVRLELRGYDGRPIITAASGVAGATFVVATFGGEGLAFAVRNPETVIGSDLVFYFLAAGLIGSGLGYWAIRHWREFAETTGGL